MLRPLEGVDALRQVAQCSTLAELDMKNDHAVLAGVVLLADCSAELTPRAVVNGHRRPHAPVRQRPRRPVPVPMRTSLSPTGRCCRRVGYPGADLLTPAGDVATADVTAYAIDTSTADACPRWGNLVIIPPNGFVSRTR